MSTLDSLPVSVPYGNQNFDVAMGGSHDMDFRAPVDTPVPFLKSGKIVDISSPDWGKQVGIQFDQSPNGVPYYAYLHLDAVNPGLQVGQHVNAGDLVGWSGGENTAPQDISNPTGTHFTNPNFQSGQPQIGIAMMYGPVYGSGKGWINNPEQHPELDPIQLLTGNPIGTADMGNTNIPGIGDIHFPSMEQVGVFIAGIALFAIGGMILVQSLKVTQTAEKVSLL